VEEVRGTEEERNENKIELWNSNGRRRKEKRRGGGNKSEKYFRVHLIFKCNCDSDFAGRINKANLRA
jgi:hypothetical protein